MEIKELLETLDEISRTLRSENYWQYESDIGIIKKRLEAVQIIKDATIISRDYTTCHEGMNCFKILIKDKDVDLLAEALHHDH